MGLHFFRNLARADSSIIWDTQVVQLWSIFQTFYEQLFCQTIRRKKLRKTFLYKKAASQLYVKLTPGQRLTTRSTSWDTAMKPGRRPD